MPSLEHLNTAIDAKYLRRVVDWTQAHDQSVHPHHLAPLPEAGNKAIAFGDFSYYWIADRQGRTFKRLNELYANNGQIGFLASQRVDGKLVLPEAVKTLTVKAK